MYFNYRNNTALCCSQYYRVNMVRINFLHWPYKEYHTRHWKKTSFTI